MMVALGTLTPTSTTVVATKTPIRPSAKAAMVASFFGGRHLAVDETDRFGTQECAQTIRPGGGSGNIEKFGFLHERANPKGLRAILQRFLQPGDHFWQASGGRGGGGDRLSPRRLLVEARNIEIAVQGQFEGAGDRRGAERQHVHGLAFGLQPRPFGHTEAVLLVYDGEAQVFEMHIILKQGVGADSDGCISLGERQQLGSAGDALISPGQENGAYPCSLKRLCDGLEVLARQDFGRGH